MKKTCLLFSTIVFVSMLSTSKAQDEKCFIKGTSAINLGIGIGNNVDYNPGVGIIPIYTGSYEYGVAKAGPGMIGIGGSVSCLRYSNPSPGFLSHGPGYTYKNTSTTIVVGLRATYHPDFCNGKKYDVYGAIQLNVYNYGSSQTSDNPNYPGSHSNSIQIYPSLLIGARYFFIPNLGVFSEFGFDYAVLKAGVSFKFGGK